MRREREQGRERERERKREGKTRGKGRRKGKGKKKGEGKEKEREEMGKCKRNVREKRREGSHGPQAILQCGSSLQHPAPATWVHVEGLRTVVWCPAARPHPRKGR